MKRFRGALHLVLSLGAGMVFALASPPFDLASGLWIGMAGLAFLLEGDDRQPAPSRRWRLAMRGGARGLMFGIGANLVAFRFVPGTITRFTPLHVTVALLALLLLSAAQALRWSAAGMVRSALVRWQVPSPIAFAAAVYAGTFVPMVFPWNPAGGAVLHPELLQLADIVGERGVSAFMALSSGFLASAAYALIDKERQRAVIALAVGLGLPLVTYVHGRLRMAQIDALRDAAPSVKIALVQPSVGAKIRWERGRASQIVDTLTELTRSAESKGAELTVWHETAYPYELMHGTHHAPRALLGFGVHGPILAGTMMAERDADDPANVRKFNSAVVVDRQGNLSTAYDKIHLLWFGEAVPLAEQIPWIKRTFARGVGLDPGKVQVPLVSDKVRASVLVCFEDILPSAGREAIGVRPNLLVNLTNDAWFVDPATLRDGEASAESELHMRMSVMRTVELRRDMVRAVNFGPTSWIDAAGRIRARYASPLPGTLMTTPALLEGPLTVYARFGDVPFALVLAASTAALVATKRRKRRARPSFSEGDAVAGARVVSDPKVTGSDP